MICNVKNIVDLAGLSQFWLRQSDSNINKTWISKKKKEKKKKKEEKNKIE